jgi:hypothetical protein
MLTEHLASLSRSEATRVADRASNEALRKAKEDKKKRQFERQARRDRGKDVSDIDKEEEAEEEKIGDDDGGVACDALVEEDRLASGDSSQQQVGEAVGLTHEALGPFPHHVGEGTSQGLRRWIVPLTHPRADGDRAHCQCPPGGDGDRAPHSRVSGT